MATFITGLEGFVGQHLLHAFPDSFFPVFGTALIEPPKPPRNDISYRKLDILDAKALADYVKEVRPERIIHLAAQSNVGTSIKNPYTTFKVNIDGTVNLVEAVRKHCPETTILLISSSEVYGITPPADEKGFSENDPTMPVNPYAASKIAMEDIGLSMYKTYGMDVRITRSFQHTGQGQSERFIFSYIAKTIAEIKLGKKPPVIELGNLDVSRDYLDVRDVVTAYMKIFDKGLPGEIYNVSGGKVITLRKMAEMIIKESGLEIELRIEKSRQRKNEIKMSAGNNEKLQKRTGWKPHIMLEDTFASMLSYWEEKLTRSIK